MSGAAKPVQTINLPTEPIDMAALVEPVAAERERVVIERDGVVVAAVVSPKDLARLRREDAYMEDWWENLRAMREAFADIPPEQLERDVAAVVAAVRAERYGSRTPQRDD